MANKNNEYDNMLDDINIKEKNLYIKEQQSEITDIKYELEQ